MAAIPYMPLYIADYLADAGHLTTLEHGAYLMLLMAYWQRGEGLPDDDVKLARIARLNTANWAKVKPAVRDFFTTRDGKLVQHRVERELEKVRDKSLKNRKGGLARAKQLQSERAKDADKSLRHTDTDTYSLAKANGADAPPVGDSDTQFWANAKAFIGGKNPGGLIGKWCRDYGQAETAKAITDAQLNRAVDPVPYIERTLLRQKQAECEMPIC